MTEVRVKAPLDGTLVVTNLYGSTKYDPPFDVDNGDGTKTRNIAHNGVDFACTLGTPVRAPWPGVVRTGWDPYGWGNYLAITTDDGRECILGHLSSFVAVTGERVAAGAVVARSGNSGSSTAPHLHMSIRERSYTYANGFLGFRDPLGGLDPDVVARLDLSRV